MDIKIKLENSLLNVKEIQSLAREADEAIDCLWSGNMDMTGWVKSPIQYDESELEYLLNVADIVKSEAQLMVVIGIGGSYMGAKAAVEALPKSEDGIDVLFAGINFCSAYHKDIIEEMSRKETVLCVVSKSGNTTEIKASFEILKDVMIKKYGSKDAAAKRIIAITDKKKGLLREEADREGYITFEIPDDIGGRYSALTPAGLFPMAVAGIDIREMIRGEAAMATSPAWDSEGTYYAISRYLLMNKGKDIEVIEFYDPKLTFLGEWMKQLYGESEGKNGKGLFPASLNFSTDLHSMGQFLQQGNQIFFETVIVVDDYDEPLVVPGGQLKGLSLEDINKAAIRGVVEAHKKAGVPIIEIHLPKLNAFYYGQLLYFLQTTSAVTGLLMKVNPFDQPGVEDYKREMREELDRK